MIAMPQEPVLGPDPTDPHDQCERDIARLEAEVEAAKHAQRPMCFAELHALVSALVGDHTYSVSVQTWRHLSTRIETIWSVSWFPDDNDPRQCRRIEGASAADVYNKLRAELPRNPLDDVGDLPW